jgi:hypothetical protein
MTTMEDEEKELKQLKTLYDELWEDARTMIRDMNRSISVYFWTGLTIVFLSIPVFANAMRSLQNVLRGSTGVFDYFYLGVHLFSTVVLALFGASLLRWYDKLKNRYSRLVQIEKTFEG